MNGAKKLALTDAKLSAAVEAARARFKVFRRMDPNEIAQAAAMARALVDSNEDTAELCSVHDQLAQALALLELKAPSSGLSGSHQVAIAIASIRSTLISMDPYIERLQRTKRIIKAAMHIKIFARR
jgi:hypothetical protein